VADGRATPSVAHDHSPISAASIAHRCDPPREVLVDQVEAVSGRAGAARY
jgi:hypothetical protein